MDDDTAKSCFEKAGGSYDAALKEAKQIALRKQEQRDVQSLCEITNVDAATALRALKESGNNVQVAAEKLLGSVDRTLKPEAPSDDDSEADEWAQV